LPAAGTKAAYLVGMDLLSGDAGLAILTCVGIAATAVSILRDAKSQKARLVAVSDEVPVDLGRAA
jgi:hypothetical protein